LERGPRGAGRGCGGFARIFGGVLKWNLPGGRQARIEWIEWIFADFWVWCGEKEPAWRHIGADFFRCVLKRNLPGAERG